MIQEGIPLRHLEFVLSPSVREYLEAHGWLGKNCKAFPPDWATECFSDTWELTLGIHAVRDSNIEVLELLYTHNRLDQFNLLTACLLRSTINFATAEWLIKHGAKITEYHMDVAARSGNHKLVSFLRKYGCPWSVRTCAIAAKYGHFMTLRLLVRHGGCPWDHNSIVHAATPEIAEWCVGNGCPQGTVEIVKVDNC